MALTNPYIIALRAGKISAVEALRNPQTTQTYSKNTVNLNQFLTESYVRAYILMDFIKVLTKIII